MQRRFLLDVIIRKCAAVLELLSCKDQTLLIRWDALFVLDLGLDVVNSVTGFDIKSDRLTSKRLYKDLHTSTKTQDQMQRRFLLDVIIRKCAAVLELLSCKDQTLLIRWDALFVLDLGLDVVNSVTGFDIKSDCL